MITIMIIIMIICIAQILRKDKVKEFVYVEKWFVFLSVQGDQPEDMSVDSSQVGHYIF